MITVTKANDNNLQEILKLEKNSFNNEAYSETAMLEELLNPNRLYLIATYNNEVVGYIGVNITFNVAEIMKIGVDKNFQGKGIGTLLLNEIEKELIKKNVNELWLEVNEFNLPAIKLYEKFGFKLVSTRKNYYENASAKIYLKNIK